jgi:hypothetical protein
MPASLIHFPCSGSQSGGCMTCILKDLTQIGVQGLRFRRQRLNNNFLTRVCASASVVSF